MDLSNPISAIIPSLEGEVYRVLARTTLPMSGSRVAELADVGSNPGIRLALARMVRQGTVSVVTAGHSPLYIANRDHLLWPTIESTVRAAEGAVADLKSRLAALATQHADPRREISVTLALFGSVAHGSSTSESDIDLLAVFPSPGMTAHDEALVDEITAEVPRWTGNDCNVYAITREGLSELVQREDSMVEAWRSGADSFFGPPVQSLLGNSRAL